MIRPAPLPEIKKDASLEELLALYETRYRELSALKGLARVHLAAPSLGRQGFQAALFLFRPEGFQMRGFDPLGGTLFDLVSRGDERRLTVSGRDQSERLEELMDRGGPIRPSFFDFLGIPRVAAPEMAVLEKGEDDFKLMVLGRKADGPPRLLKAYLIERGEFRAVQTIYYSESGFPQANLFFSDFRKVKGFWLPFEVSGESKQGRAEFTFLEMKPNPEGPDPAHRFDAAPGD